MNKQKFYYKRATELLNDSLQRVPFYRDNWAKYDPGNFAAIDVRFAAMPVLSKTDMRKNFPSGLISDNADVDRGLRDNAIEYTFTSGTTGERSGIICNPKHSYLYRSEQRCSKFADGTRSQDICCGTGRKSCCGQGRNRNAGKCKGNFSSAFPTKSSTCLQ